MYPISSSSLLQNLVDEIAIKHCIVYPNGLQAYTLENEVLPHSLDIGTLRENKLEKIKIDLARYVNIEMLLDNNFKRDHYP